MNVFALLCADRRYRIILMQTLDPGLGSFMMVFLVSYSFTVGTSLVHVRRYRYCTLPISSRPGEEKNQ